MANDVLTTQDVRDAIEQLRAAQARSRWPDGRYRLVVHPDSMVGRALRAGRSVAEVKTQFGVELVGDVEIVSGPPGELATVTGSRAAIAHGSYRVRPVGIVGVDAGVGWARSTMPEVARAERAGLRRWRPTGRKAR